MKKKPPSPQTVIRRLRLSIKERDLRIEHLKRNLQETEARLLEARRRTIPLNDGSELNFLPIHISRVQIHRDVKQLYGREGYAHNLAPGRVEVTIHAEGDLIQFAPPAAKPLTGAP